jgi:hypothetical protein
MAAKRRTRRIFSAVMTAALSIAVIIFAAVGLTGLDRSLRSRQTATVQKAVTAAVNECYALEGTYPPDLEYLHDNYGLVLDTQHYIYDYSVFASNIAPTIHVLNRG